MIAIATMRGFNWIQEVLDSTMVFIFAVVIFFAIIGFIVGRLLPGLFAATISFLYLTMQVDNEMLNQIAWIIAILIVVVAAFRIAGFVLGGSE